MILRRSCIYCLIALFQAYLELFILMGHGILIHMIMSKLFHTQRRNVIVSIITMSILSIVTYLVMSKSGLLPLFGSKFLDTILRCNFRIITFPKLIFIAVLEYPWPIAIFSQIIYHTTLYCAATVLKRSFTLGELSIVSQSITFLATEASILTLKKVTLSSTVTLPILIFLHYTQICQRLLLSHPSSIPSFLFRHLQGFLALR